MLTRRGFALFASAFALASAAPGGHWFGSPARAFAPDGTPVPAARVERRWKGSACACSVTNSGAEPVRLGQIVLFEGAHYWAPQARIYGEGFTMLSQTGGTLAQPLQLGGYTGRKHYRIPEPEDATTVYNVLCAANRNGSHSLLGFTSSHRWACRFHLRPETIQITLDCEGLTLGPGETWQLEEFCRLEGNGRAALFSDFGRRIAAHHPRLDWPAPPEGWCSWYCFGPRVTAQQVTSNLEWIARNAPNLRYIQIDDGYQPAMGDWLETGTAFGGPSSRTSAPAALNPPSGWPPSSPRRSPTSSSNTLSGS